MSKKAVQFMTEYAEHTRSPLDKRKWSSRMFKYEYATPELRFNGKVAPYEVKYTDVSLFRSSGDPVKVDYKSSPIFKAGDLIGLVDGEWYRNGVKK